MRRLVRLLACLSVMASPVFAEDDAKPLDLATLDKDMVKDTLGTWVIRDESGKKTCKVKLRSEMVIGGYQIDVDKKCAKRFPAMDNVASWRLLEGWQIALVDTTRKEILRFYTPDNSYISDKEIDGIFAIDKK